MLAKNEAFNSGCVTYKFNVAQAGFKDAYDLFMCSTQLRGDRMEIVMSFCENHILGTFTKRALKLLCSMVEIFINLYDASNHPFSSSS